MPRTGAEFMALETTAEAGTCLAWRSMLGLVGSSTRAEGAVGEAIRRLNLSVPPAPASHPGRDHIPKAPEAPQGPAGSMPTAEGADPPRVTSHCGHRGSASASSITLRAPRSGVKPSLLVLAGRQASLKPWLVSPPSDWELLEDKDHLPHQLGAP